MSKIFSIILILLNFTIIAKSKDNQIYLIVRGDDIGSSHAANLACIDTYNNGIVRSVEIMAPCSWFPEAVNLINNTTGLDVGIHLTLTSEWQNIKWKPLTNCPGLTDQSGYFFPFIWKNENYPPNNSLLESTWNIDEIEKEFRAQIELALVQLPQLSHITAHMGCTNISPEVYDLTLKLAQEYQLVYITDSMNVKSINGINLNSNALLDEKVNMFIQKLSQLEPGKWLFVEHPGMDVPEMQAHGHIGYENVAQHRHDVTQIMTNPKVKKAINDYNIKLINYADLIK